MGQIIGGLRHLILKDAFYVSWIEGGLAASSSRIKE